MQFATPHNIIIIILLCTLIVSWLLYRAWTQTKYFKTVSFWPTHKTIKSKLTESFTRLFLLGIMTIVTVIALLQPTWGVKTITSTVEGSDVLFVLDVSNSMRALDMSLGRRTLDRLTAAKLLISDLVTAHPENRYGLVLFAGDAFVSSPLTSDTTAFLTFLDAADTGDTSLQGTDMSQALSLALDRFSTTDTEDADRGEAIVLISDGGEDAPADLPVLAETAKNEGIRIFTLGVGGDKGVPIPESQDVFGRINYLTHNGTRVYTTLNEAPLKELARVTDSVYLHLESGADLNTVAKELRTLPTTKRTQTTTQSGAPHFDLFLLASLFFLLLYSLGSHLQLGLTTISNRLKKLYD